MPTGTTTTAHVRTPEEQRVFDRSERQRSLREQLASSIPSDSPTQALSYLKVGEKFYSVNFVGDNLDINKEIETFFKQKIEELKALVVEDLVDGTGAEVDAYLERIRRMSSRGQVAINSDKMGKPIFVESGGQNEVMETRPFVWRPWVIKGHFHHFVEYLQLTEGFIKEQFPEDQRERLRDVSIEMTFTQDHLVVPGIVGFTRNNTLRLIAPHKLPHSVGGTQLCIGNGSAENYFRQMSWSQLSQELSRINLFSLGSHAFQVLRSDGDTPIRGIIRGTLRDVSWRLVNEERASTASNTTAGGPTGWRL